MVTIIGILITYIGFGLTLFGVRENYSLTTYLNDLVRAPGWTTGDKFITAGIICIIAGTICILINAKWQKNDKKKYPWR